MKAVFYTKYRPPEVPRIQDGEKPDYRDDEVRIKIPATPVT
jgi:NADPH:quinone reductase-like Zn-dependent oxidoreductase